VVASSCADAALAARSAARLISRARRRLVYVMPHMTLREIMTRGRIQDVIMDYNKEKKNKYHKSEVTLCFKVTRGE